MPGKLLTTGSTVQCPHGGQALLLTSQTAVIGRGGPVLVASDVHVVMGCPFTIGPKYSPCVRIEWKAPATTASVGPQKPLVETSIGICYGAEGAPQGVAIVVANQQEVSAL